MATITLKGNPVETHGTIPPSGTKAPDFTLVTTDLGEKSLDDYSGKRLVLNIFPSVDTPTCAASVRKFNEQAAKLDNTTVLCISNDLPFAMARFCGAEGLDNVEALSAFRSEFGRNYQVELVTGPLKGLLSRAVIVVNADGEVIHSEQVAEIADEPDYEAALAVL